MMPRRAVLTLILVVMSAAACSRRQPPPVVEPAARPDTVGQGQRALDTARDRARQDSIARADAERQRLAREAGERDARVRAILEEMVFFEYDQSVIRGDAQQILARKVSVLRANPNVALTIAGHADERGSVEYNLALGARRASAVREYLEGFGIAGNRLEVTSYGEDRPLDPGSSESAWARNRRAEFTILRGGSNLIEPGN
jgi:peptidoglycan-associated lipoprotein